MEIIDKSMRETQRRLKAMLGDGSRTRYSTRHVRVHQNPLMISFVRAAGMNQPWGVIYGRVLDVEPRISVASDPRRPAAVEEAMDELATYILEHFGVAHFSSHPLVSGTIQPEDMPQIWLADQANLSMLHNVGFAYFSDIAGDSENKLGAMARLFNFLYEHSTIAGHQLVVNAAELLNNLFVLAADEKFSSNLSSSLAWIKSSKDINQTRIDAIRALEKTEGVTLDRDVENTLFATISSISPEVPAHESVAKLVREALEPELAKRWSLLKTAWIVANEDARAENQHVGTLVADSLIAFRRDFQSLELVEQTHDAPEPRVPLTDNDSTVGALYYLRALEADDKFITHIVHNDREFLGDLFYDGSAFMGQILSIFPGDGAGEWTWQVKLSEKFGRLLKKREAESYCLIGKVTNPAMSVTGFEKVAGKMVGGADYWVLELTWSKQNALKLSESTHTDLNKSDSWIGKSLIFVPSFAVDLHRNAQTAVVKSPKRLGAWLTKAVDRVE